MHIVAFEESNCQRGPKQ